MVRVNQTYLLKRGLLLAGGLFLFFLILPSDYISKGAGSSFGVVMESRLYLKKFAERKLLLNQSCNGVNLTEISSPKTLLYSKQLGLIYCPVSLAGSTSIKQSLLLAENKTLRLGKLYHLPMHQSIHSQAQELNLHESTLKNSNTANKLATSGLTLLMVVRNPWRRLVSFYKDIVSGSWSQAFTKCSQFVNREEGILTFSGFLNCIVFYANGTTSLTQLDMRLTPASTTCAVCKIPYNTIVHYENIEDELGAVGRAANSEYKLINFYHKATPNNYLLDDEYYQMQIQSVPAKLIEKTQKLYEKDFTLFGYKML